MHTGFLNLVQEKMSKSLGNFFTIRDVLKTVDARVLRYFLLSHHYRSPIDYDPEMLEQAAAALKRLENFVLRLPADDGGAVPESAEVRDAREAMLAALDDDFDAPAALGALFAFIRDQNRRDQPAAGARRLMEDFDRIFGVLPAAGDAGEDDAWIQERVDERQRMRAERNFGEADAIRDELARLGVVVEDTSEGVRWHREAGSAG
jgi:cysteinyl-tRNA synthetase